MNIICYRGKDISFHEIGRREGCDWRTAKKYIDHPDLFGKKRVSAPRPSVLDPFRDQIAAYLADEYGNHSAQWIYEQIVKSGYTHSYDLVKREVHKIKGEKQRLAYIRFETLPGQQAQVDFGEFMVALPDGSSKKYYLFAMILGYSRKLFACLLERCDLPSFLEAHILAFEHFGGVPQEILYDRMRNVYIRSVCDTPDPSAANHGVGRPLFTQSLMTLAIHYGFKPEVAPAYAPWVKGKVERPMDFLRAGWWLGYDFTNLATANTDLSAWLAMKDERVHGTTRERVDVRFTREKAHLLALPPHRCDVSERLMRTVRKDCMISVDANRYILPHTLVGRDVIVRVSAGQSLLSGGHDRNMRIFADDVLIETYEMPEGKGELVGLDRGYYEALRADRQMQARKFGNSGKQNGKQKGRARFKRTISPTTPPHMVEVSIAAAAPLPPLAVQRRSIDEYARLGGEVAYAG